MYVIIPQENEKLTDISNVLKANNIKFEYPDKKAIKKVKEHMFFIRPFSAIVIVQSLGFDLVSY